MCRRVECAKCGRPTFAGCGAHVDEVLRDVPRAKRRCPGKPVTASARETIPETAVSSRQKVGTTIRPPGFTTRPMPRIASPASPTIRGIGRPRSDIDRS